MTAPFDTSGVTRGPDGIKRCDGLPDSLVHMLRGSVELHPGREAVAETGGGPRLSYREMWDRAARVAGGLRAAGVQRGDRVALRLGNGVDWVLAFFGAALAGGIVVPVNTRLSEAEVAFVGSDSGAQYVFAPGGKLLKRRLRDETNWEPLVS
jgi:long-chain acyl-CoA synthetase